MFRSGIMIPEWASSGLAVSKFSLTAIKRMLRIHVNDSVGVFLVQRIAALSVKHNMSSVSVLGGW